MSQFLESRPRGGSAGQSFLSLDDGHNSSPPKGTLPPIPTSSVSGSRIPSGQYIASSPRHGYDGSDAAFDTTMDSSSESFPRRRKGSQSPRLSSPPRSSRNMTLQAAPQFGPSGLTPDRELVRPPFDAEDSSSRDVPTATGPSSAPQGASRIGNSRGSRLGALIGRNLKGSNSTESPSRSNPPVNESDELPSSAASTSTSGMSEPEPSSSGSGGGLASRFLRSKGSRNKLKDIPEPNPGRPEAQRLAPAFGLRSEDHYVGPTIRSASAMGMLNSRAEDSPTIPDFDPAQGDTGPRRTLGRPSSHSNLLQAALSSGAQASHGPPSNRVGRLGRLQYNKNDSITVAGVARDTTGSHAPAPAERVDTSFVAYRAQQYLERGPISPTNHPNHTEMPDEFGVDPRQENDEMAMQDWQQRRLALSQMRGASGAAGLAGLGIGTPSGPSMYGDSSTLSSPQGATAIQQPRELILPSLSARASEALQGQHPALADPRQRSAIEIAASRRDVPREASPVIGKARTEADDAARHAAGSRAASRASVQDSYHNRFSKQTASDRSSSQYYGTQSRDALHRALGELSPTLDGPDSSSAFPPHQHQQQPQQQQSNRQPSTSSQHQSRGMASSTTDSPNPDPGSPAVGGLSDAAIVALGAIPGTGPESLLNANGASLSSKNVLTIALQKAQSAVQLDSSNNVPEAIAAYRQAVRLLQEVMERIAPKNGRRTRPSREEERRRLRVIQDTYADRIRLLSMIYSPEETDDHPDESSRFDSSQDQDYDRAGDRNWSRDSEYAGRGINSDLAQHDADRGQPDDAEHSFLVMTPVRPDHPTMQATRLDKESSDDRFDSLPMGQIRSSISPKKTKRSSVAISLADEQENAPLDPLSGAETEPTAGSLSAMPQISIQPVTPLTRYDAPETQEVLIDPVLKEPQVSEADSMHNRSDSDSSFRSTQTNSRLNAPSGHRSKAFGLEEELKTPVTPYFDTADVTAFTDEDLAGDDRRPRVLPTTGPDLDPKRFSKMIVAKRAKAFNGQGNSLRPKASMPLLPKASEGTSEAGADDSKVQRRPSTADSPPNPAGSPVVTAPVSVAVAAPLRSPFESEGETGPAAAAGWPRASMMVPNQNGKSALAGGGFLVSSTVTAGTISQRRKQQGWNQMSEFPSQDNLMAVPAVAEVMARARSADHAANSTLRGRSDSLASPAAATTAARHESSSLNSSPFSTLGRQRAVSQPGSRRPSIPAAFIAANAAAGTPVDQPPPVPRLSRKLSSSDLLLRGQDSAPLDASQDPASFSVDRPQLPLRYSSFNVLQQRQSQPASAPLGPLVISDIFPSGLPSLASGSPSYSSTNSSVSLPLLSLGGSLPDPSSIPPVPAMPVLRPFHMMRQLLASIRQGGYVTQRLYVPKGLRTLQGARLVSIESKVRALELISTGIESVGKGGEPLLRPLGTNGGLETSNASRFVKHLDEFDSLMVEVQNNLAKKLGFLETVTGKKAASSFGVFGSKLTRSLDRMTNGTKNLDSPVAYIESVARLFKRAQVIDQHLHRLLRSQGGAVDETAQSGDATPRDAYFALPAELRGNIESRLKRSSDFFANVVLAFFLRDLGVLLDKFVKKGSAALTD